MAVGVDLGLLVGVVGEAGTGDVDGGGDEGVGGGLDMRDSDGDVRLPWKHTGMMNEESYLFIYYSFASSSSYSTRAHIFQPRSFVKTGRRGPTLLLGGPPLENTVV